MKKRTPYLLGLCLVLLGLLIYSCSKRYEDPANFNAPNETAVPQDLLKAAENWHIQQTGVSASNKTVLSNGKKSYVLQPVWEKAKLQRTSNGKASIVAPSPEFALSAKAKSGVVRKFIFDTEGDKITGGKIVELYADSAYISAHKRDLAEKYNNSDMAGFTGAVITYDVNYKYLKSEVYKDGVLQTNATAQLTRGKEGETQGQGGKTTLGRPITTLDYSCYDVYYVTTYYYDGYPYYQTWDYLYSYCTGSNNEYGGGGGGGTVGGGSPPSNPTPGPGDHALQNTANLPPATTTDTQVANLCVFKTLEWVAKYFNFTLNSGTSLLTFLQTNPTIIVNNTTIPVDLNFVLQYGTPDTYIHGIIGQYFNYSTTNSVQTAIDANHPVMAAIENGTHQVMITGYNNNGTYTYFDPALGTYNTQTPGAFTDIVEIVSKK